MDNDKLILKLLNQDIICHASPDFSYINIKYIHFDINVEKYDIYINRMPYGNIKKETKIKLTEYCRNINRKDGEILYKMIIRKEREKKLKRILK
jgi:hypothetical protein